MYLPNHIITTNRRHPMAQKRNNPKPAKKQAQDQDDDGSAPEDKIVAPRRQRERTARQATHKRGGPKKFPKAQKDHDPDDIIDLSSVASDSTTEEDIRRPAKSVKDVERMVERIRKCIARHERWCPFIHRSRQLRSLNRRVRDLEDSKAALGGAVDGDDELDDSSKAKKPQKTNTKQPKAALKKPLSSPQEEDARDEDFTEPAGETPKADQGAQGRQRTENLEHAEEDAVVNVPGGSGSDDNLSDPPDETNADLKAAYAADTEQTGKVETAKTSNANKAGGGRKRKPQDAEVLAEAKSQEGKKAKKTRQRT